MNLSELSKQLEGYEIQEGGDQERAPLLTPEELKDGDVIKVKAVYGSHKVGKQGNDLFTFKVEVLEGPLEGRGLFVKLFFSAKEESKDYNARLLAKLKAMGVTDRFLQSGASADAIIEAAKGTPFTIKVRWDEPREYEGKVYNDLSTYASWKPVDDTPGGYVPGSGVKGF